MKKKDPSTNEPRYAVYLYLAFVIVTSFFTYFYRYQYPPHPFWDEPYHIASAEKYLHGVYFMEPHPPLGKLFIALGEKLLHPNVKADAFIKTDYAKDFPPGFSFAGYRLFPTIFGWLSAVVIFFIFLIITRSSALAALLSFLYIFDNAHIVHSRGAMLDSTLSFFTLLALLLFLLLSQKKKDDIVRFCLLSILFGFAFACALTTKVVGLILILLVPSLIIRLVPDWRKIVIFCLAGSVSFCLVYVAVWQVHFSLASTIVKELADDGYYQASQSYKDILRTKKTSSPASFPVMLRDSLKFVSHYSKGVPRLDLCKTDENGSPPFFWPFGGRTINYRWEKEGEEAVRYMYLVPNPVAWGLGLIGVVLSIILLISRCIGDRKESLEHEYTMLTLLALYGGYMVAISSLTRVMYLYHYFLPLEFSFILFALAFMNIRQVFALRMTENARLVMMTILGLLIFAAFQFYRPLSYYEPLTKSAFELRVINPLWELTCVGCDKKSTLVIPRSN